MVGKCFLLASYSMFGQSLDALIYQVKMSMAIEWPGQRNPLRAAKWVWWLRNKTKFSVHSA